MSENDAQQAPRRHGRRARQLTPEEAAEQRALAAQRTGELPRTADDAEPGTEADSASGSSDASSDGPSPHGAPAADDPAASDRSGATGALPSGRPSLRGAVAAPSADSPVPKLRKFGKRARIIEVEPEEAAPADQDAAAADRAPADEPAGAASNDESTGAAGTGATPSDPAATGAATPGTATTGAATAGTTAAASTLTIERDADGVELGELGVGEAPGPKPAPRFDGRVLNRPEQSRGTSLLWVVWVLIALAIIALVVLLATGVLGAGSDQALAVPHLDALRAALAAADPSASVSVPTDLEVTSA